ncbi:MAG: beta-ketoacyl-ACP synthase 3 [Akkermansiaceae bacterium]|nr:beta-ketoacyl-ACP synthase 3 [Armatimonadota bacterium]
MHTKTISLPVKIAGLGTYLPERVVTNEELEADLGLDPGWIAKRTGICERHYNTGETAIHQAAQAVTAALARAGLTVSDVDAFVGASSGPQQLIPCNAALLQRELGAPDGGSMCFDINATCLSFPVALHTVAPLVASGAYRCAVIFSTEIASRSLNPDQKESAVLFGDAAAAAVLVRTPDGESSAIHLARFATHSSGAEHTQFRGAGSAHHPNDPWTTTAMNQFDMNGPAIFLQGARAMTPFLDSFFAELGIPRQAIRHVVPHQASGHAVDLLHKRLGFCSRQVVRNLETRGNCIAASIPVALTEAVQAGRIERGDSVLLVGTGAGLTLGALALTY